MAGRGRGMTLPAWMTAGGAGQQSPGVPLNPTGPGKYPDPPGPPQLPVSVGPPEHLRAAGLAPPGPPQPITPTPPGPPPPTGLPIAPASAAGPTANGTNGPAAAALMVPPGPPGPQPGMSHQVSGQLQPWQGPSGRDPLEEEVQARVLQEQDADLQLALRQSG